MRPWQVTASALKVIPLCSDDELASPIAGDFDAYLPWAAHATGDSSTACIDVCISYVVTIWTSSWRIHSHVLQICERRWEAGACVGSGTYQRAKRCLARSPLAISTVCWGREESHQAWCLDRPVRGASDDNGDRACGFGRRIRIRWRLCDNRRQNLRSWIRRRHLRLGVLKRCFVLYQRMLAGKIQVYAGLCNRVNRSLETAGRTWEGGCGYYTSGQLCWPPPSS
jgi:hypothetical protein